MSDELLDMLAYRRPAFSETEEVFIETYLYPLGVKRDDFGNIIKQIGDSNILWSCHTDTVHREEGMQAVAVTGKLAHLPRDSTSNCLGADCTTGVWMMRQMILEQRPGLYIFHRAEEIGGRGSAYIRDNTPDLLDGIDIAVAFDRYGYTSIITHQFDRCCSEEFSRSLSRQLPGYVSDDGGTFTDTANYTDLVAECTNLSVGYDHQHQRTETQHLGFPQYLLRKVLALDETKLAIDRDPSVTYHRPAHTSYLSIPSTCQLIRNNPESVAGLLALYGVSHSELVEHIFSENGTLQGEYW